MLRYFTSELAALSARFCLCVFPQQDRPAYVRLTGPAAAGYDRPVRLYAARVRRVLSAVWTMSQREMRSSLPHPTKLSL